MPGNRPHHPTIAEDIASQQQKIIVSLREENASLKQQVNRLHEVEQEYNELRGAFAANGNLSYYQAIAPILQRRNQIAEAEKQRYNLERQQQWEAEQAAQREADEKAVRDENPDLIKYYQKEKDKITQRRDKMLDLCNKFYEMSESEANLYFADDHKPEQSAVMDLIGEFKNEQGYIQFQCSYCEYIANSVGSLERHCYNEGEDHKNVTLRRIQDNAIAAMGKVSAQLTIEIDNAIRAKKNQEQKAEIEKRQADQAEAKKRLPLVK
ncbi:MAG TPA: hypothetical protein VFJ05_06940 [Nitrososphaeraceae archaeon]|nr:hypothetical protein [Nitrososphaeraceae archaeon]